MRPLIPLLLLAGALAAAENAKDRYAASYAAEARRDWKGAIAAIEPLLDEDPSDYLSNLRLGWLRYCAGEHRGAQIAYGIAARRAPNSLEPRLGLILPLVAQGQWGEVEKQARLALRLDANNASANRWLAESLLAAGRSSEAFEITERIADRFPADATLAELQARARAVRGDRAGARQAYQRLQLLDPTNAAAAAGLNAQ
jgi:cytochrome c-type biogenesis protein CcmH/NrfG